MKVVFAEAHRGHDPVYQIVGFEKTAYPERCERLDNIGRSLDPAAFEFVSPLPCDRRAAASIHSEDYLTYLSSAYQRWVAAGYSGDGVVPDTFAFRIPSRKADGILNQAGWHCFDSSTPIVEGTYDASLYSAGCAITGASLLREGNGHAYAMCRPPGHHSGSDYCGGFCYLNNAALAANHLLTSGPKASGRPKVAILDIDYHHGNGTQDIFYGTNEVFFVSLHADPNQSYPYYWGHEEEKGRGAGTGYTMNLPLPLGTNAADYMKGLERGLDGIHRYDPAYLIVSLGTDTCAADPLGTFDLPVAAFAQMGGMIAGLRRPTLIVQEGGYLVDELGLCVASFLEAIERPV